MKNVLIFFVVLLSFNTLIGQEITMFPGFWSSQYYQDDKRLKKKDVGLLLENVPVASAYWNKANKQNNLVWACVLAQAGFLGWQISNRNNFRSQTAPLIGNIAFGITGIILSVSSSNNRKNAILSYNASFDTGFEIHPSKNGLGLTLHF